MYQVAVGLESSYNNVMEKREAKRQTHKSETTGRGNKINQQWAPVFFVFCPLYVNWFLEKILQKVAGIEGKQTLFLSWEVPLSFNMKKQ